MTIDFKDYSFWILALIWFTVPILSWLWSFATIYLYRKTNVLLKEVIENLERSKTMHDTAVNTHSDNMSLKLKTEEELKAACAYYEKIKDLLDLKKKGT